jgi:hypothetical protein
MRPAVKAALVAVSIIVPTEALSATITVHEPDGEGRVFVDVVGTINDEDFKTFKEKTDQIYPIGAGYPRKQVIVTLVSYGGSINPALQIGDLIRKRGLSTFVPGDRTCTSACALIWLAGVPRTVGDTPQIGFHAAYDRTSGREVGSSNAVVGAYLRDLGVGYKAIVFMTRKGPTSVEWLTPDLAMHLGVTWAMLQRPRAIPIPPQHKLQPHLRAPPEVIAAWSKWAAAQLPTATAPASPKLMPLVRPAGPLPEQAPATQQPAAPPAAPAANSKPPARGIEIEPGSQQATPGAQPAAADPFESPRPSFPSVAAVCPPPDLVLLVPGLTDPRCWRGEKRLQQALQQLLFGTAPAPPASPKSVITVPVRPTLPEPVPQQASPTPQTQQPAAKVEEPPIAARPKITDRFEPGTQQAPTTTAPALGAQPAVTAAQKVVLYEEDPADPNGKRFVGSAIWRTAMVTAVLGQPPQLVIRADIEVPERKLAMTFSFRRNTDKGLPATHTVEINFKLPADFLFGGVSNVPGILMKQAESTRGVPLAGLAVKVTPGFYLIGLSNQEADKERNLQLLKERGWFDIPVVYNNNRRAILAMEKGPPGDRAFADAFEAWKQ